MKKEKSESVCSCSSSSRRPSTSACNSDQSACSSSNNRKYIKRRSIYMSNQPPKVSYMRQMDEFDSFLDEASRREIEITHANKRLMANVSVKASCHKIMEVLNRLDTPRRHSSGPSSSNIHSTESTQRTPRETIDNETAKEILSRLKYLEEELKKMRSRGMPEAEFDIGTCFVRPMDENVNFSWRPPQSPSPVELQATTQQTNEQVRKPGGTIRLKMKERKNKEVVEPIDVELHTPVAPKLKETRPVRGLKKSQYLLSSYVLVQSTPRYRVADEKLIPNPPTFFSKPPPPPLLLEPYVQPGCSAPGLFIGSKANLLMKHRLHKHHMVDDFWAMLFCGQANEYLDERHVDIWVRLLNERMPPDARWTVMPSSFFCVFGLFDWSGHALGDPIDPMDGGKSWLDVDRVFFPICLSPDHWLLGELWLDTMTMNLYDSLRSFQAIEKVDFFACEELLNHILRTIGHPNIDHLPSQRLVLNVVDITDLPQQGYLHGDCGVFTLMYLEQLVSGKQAGVNTPPDMAALLFRNRMSMIYLGSCSTFIPLVV